MSRVEYIILPNQKDKKFRLLALLHSALQCPYGRKALREDLVHSGRSNQARLIPKNIKVVVDLDRTKEIFDYHLEDTIELIGFKK